MKGGRAPGDYAVRYEKLVVEVASRCEDVRN